MENRLEAKPEAPNFHWIISFQTVMDHPDTFPVRLAELSVIVSVQRRALHTNKDMVYILY